MPLKYFSTRGGDERLSFEEVRAPVSPSQPNLDSLAVNCAALGGRRGSLCALDGGTPGLESCVGVEEQLACGGQIAQVAHDDPFPHNLTRPEALVTN